MVIAIDLAGFNNLGHLVTPIFLLMDHLLHQKIKKKENLLIICLNFLQDAPASYVLFSCLFICAVL